ncbi:MAG: hypothetical protein ACK501_05955 [Planctomycetota bacterium]|jgi:DNA-directed RNA polymerase subunit RPC12/RpoP
MTMAETKKKPEQQTDDRGIECRACGCGHFYVLETRSTWGRRIRRMRECRTCGKRVTTYEKESG